MARFCPNFLSLVSLMMESGTYSLAFTPTRLCAVLYCGLREKCSDFVVWCGVTYKRSVVGPTTRHYYNKQWTCSNTRFGNQPMESNDEKQRASEQSLWLVLLHPGHFTGGIQVIIREVPLSSTRYREQRGSERSPRYVQAGAIFVSLPLSCVRQKALAFPLAPTFPPRTVLA